MQISVDINWPDNHRRGVLTTEHPQSSYGIPVLVFDGEPCGPAELAPDVRVTATWRKVRTGPVWALIQKAIDAGYPIEVDAVGV